MVRNTITKTPLIFKVVSLYVVVISSLWMIGAYNQTAIPAPVAYSVIEATQPTEMVSGQPSQLTIARLSINLEVLAGAYDMTSDTWTLTDTAAHFASMTALPNNKHGNTFIYGHNTAAVLEPVKDLVPGDLLSIRTANGHVFNYSYVDDLSVTPNQTDVLNPESATPRVTLMTCQGINSETRRIMHFDFIGMS